MSHAVIIKNAVKKYGDFTALNGVSLDIKQGEFFTLLGPSGCGKTTLLRMIAGFNTVDGGEICFDDRVINTPCRASWLSTPVPCSPSRCRSGRGFRGAALRCRPSCCGA